jgi:signal transduction histidine kinase
MKPKSEEGEMLKLRTEELILKTEELKQTSNSLLESNNALEVKTEELANAHAHLFESNHQLASINKELSATNKMFADTNKRFAQLNEKLSETSKELARVNKKLALANEQTKSKEEATRDFFNIASHELRTPTQSILGYSELLQILFEEEEAEREEEQRIAETKNSSISSTAKEREDQKKRALEAILKNVTRLNMLQKDILDITKIESNKLILNKERFSLTENIRGVIADIITNQDASNDNENIKIKFESKGKGTENDIFVEADKLRIYQVISNLLQNAIKFVSAGGIITVTADVSTTKEESKIRGGRGLEEEEGEEVVLVKVKDPGTGIAANILPRLFTKFATSSSEGIGLGLYISKNIVEAHGGRIWAENNPDGKGATFSFNMPCFSND